METRRAEVAADERRDAAGRRRRVTQATVDAQAEWWPVIMAEVAEAVARQNAAVASDVYDVILREIPELHDDKIVSNISNAILRPLGFSPIR